MAKRISGSGICVSPFVVRVCFWFLCWDLPTYMTTGVHVDLILTCFFEPQSVIGHTGEKKRKALLSEAGFEKVFRTQNWVR